MSTSYKEAGVDLEKNSALKEDIKRAVRTTFNKDVLSDVGLFGGLFDIAQAQKMRHPVLVASTDGVGTKMKVARAAGRFSTVGIDLVNHCVNDILVQGARPLFFMDYIAAQRLEQEVTAQILSGLAKGCAGAGMALLGGETAEMPGVYAEGEYDLAGTIVGIVEKDAVIDGRAIVEGDVLLGLPSDGLHTNGYSLARRVLLEKQNMPLDVVIPALGMTLADALLAPHRNYAKDVLPLIGRFGIKGMAHITGGGFDENVPRVLPEGLGAQVDTSRWQVPALFRLIAEEGGIAQQEMLRTFNMGIGFVIIASAADAQKLQGQLPGSSRIGKITKGAGVSYV